MEMNLHIYFAKMHLDSMESDISDQSLQFAFHC